MKNVLAIGAHSDDVEFGCGGTLIKHIDNGDKVYILIMSNGDIKHSVTGELIRTSEETHIESKCAADFMEADLIQLNFLDREVPFNFESITEIEKVINNYNIDIVYTHWGGDTHQDHINTLKSSLAAGRLVDNVFCYEQIPVPRVTNTYPVANYYVDITQYMDKKIEACKCHLTQIDKYIKMDIDMIDGLSVLAKYRGNQIGRKYAEAFDILKMVE
jgi:LmbE family N-acetylglucosaminyl deacetylase